MASQKAIESEREATAATASINKTLTELTIGYTFADPRNCRPHSTIRVERKSGVEVFKQAFAQHGWDTNQKIVAIELEDEKKVTPLSTIFATPEEEVSIISWHTQSFINSHHDFSIFLNAVFRSK